MKMQKIVKLVLMIALLSGITAPVWADLTDVNPADGFTYNTRRTIKVDIQVNTPNNEPTGLSFYSKGVDGLRLLDNQNIDRTGLYQGKLNIPAYMKSVVVKSRWLDSFQEVELKISGQTITAVIDHF
jgi:hypothetical protein